MNINKEYYYDKNKTRLISYIILMLLLPIHITFYNKGIYGYPDINLKFFTFKFISEGLIYDLPLLIIIGGGLLNTIKQFKKNKTNYVPYKKIEDFRIIIFLILTSIILLYIYFFNEAYISIGLFITIPGYMWASIYYVVTNFLKKEII